MLNGAHRFDGTHAPRDMAILLLRPFAWVLQTEAFSVLISAHSRVARRLGSVSSRLPPPEKFHPPMPSTDSLMRSKELWYTNSSLTVEAGSSGVPPPQDDERLLGGVDPRGVVGQFLRAVADPVDVVVRMSWRP